MKSPLPVALLIQLCAIALACIAAGGRWIFVQPMIAVIIAGFARQPWWWCLIHILFVPLAVVASKVSIPPMVWLSAFIITWFVFGRVYKSRVPLFLSSRKAMDALCELIPDGSRVLDAGAGTGTVLIALSRRHDLHLTGVEHAWGPWMFTQIRLKLAHANARLQRADLMVIGWKEYDVVYAFLSPAMMPAVWEKARGEMSRGALLVSNSFPINGARPDQVIEIGPSEGARLYLWQMR